MSNQHNTTPLFLDCKRCSKEFRVSPSRKGIRFYCSSVCYWESLKGKKQTEEYKRNARNALKKKYESGELVNAMKGKHYPDGVRLKRLTNPNILRGEKSHLWNGGGGNSYKEERKRIMSTVQYKIWRRDVFERDKYTCQECGAKNGNGKTVVLQADHIKPFATHFDLRFKVDNGKTLCIGCHRKTSTYGRTALTFATPSKVGNLSALTEDQNGTTSS